MGFAYDSVEDMYEQTPFQKKMMKFSLQKLKQDKLSEKFTELKSLALSYKDKKDLEIKKLNLEIDNFRIMAEESNNLYESMLDRTTKSLEKIIENTGSTTKVQ